MLNRLLTRPWFPPNRRHRSCLPGSPAIGLRPPMLVEGEDYRPNAPAGALSIFHQDVALWSNQDRGIETPRRIEQRRGVVRRHRRFEPAIRLGHVRMVVTRKERRQRPFRKHHQCDAAPARAPAPDHAGDRTNRGSARWIGPSRAAATVMLRDKQTHLREPSQHARVLNDGHMPSNNADYAINATCRSAAPTLRSRNMACLAGHALQEERNDRA
jgi:hypothetical protein